MKKLIKLSGAIILALVLGVVGVGCSRLGEIQAPDMAVGQGESASKETSSKEGKTIKFGVAPGPYGDMVKLAIQPELERKGYKVEIIEFSDYVQPNLALGNEEINVNMFQHSVYLETFAKEHALELSAVISIPTASMGIYANKQASLEELSDGAVVTIPNDAPNLARALRFLTQVNLITLKSDVDLSKVSEKDIEENPKNLKFTPVEAAQLPRTLDSADISVINGNYAISAGLSLSDAIAKEKLEEPYKNIIAVRTADKDAQFVKDIEEIVKSDAFKQVILEDKNIFKDFDFPEWFSK